MSNKTNKFTAPSKNKEEVKPIETAITPVVDNTQEEEKAVIAPDTQTIVPQAKPQPVLKPEPKPLPIQEPKPSRASRANASQWQAVNIYVKEMNTLNFNTPASAAVQQQRLSSAFINLFASEKDDAVAVDNIKQIIKLIKENSAAGEAFHVRTYLRNIEETSLSAARRSEFEILYYVLHLIAISTAPVRLDWEMVKRRFSPVYAESLLTRIHHAADIRIVD